MLCGVHGARASAKMLIMKRTFTEADISTYQEKYRAMRKLKCHCPENILLVVAA